jgi:hypothetical protein
MMMMMMMMMMIIVILVAVLRVLINAAFVKRNETQQFAKATFFVSL